MVSIRPKTFVFGIGNLDILKSVVNLRYVNRQPKARKPKTSEARRRGRAGGYCEAVGGVPPTRCVSGGSGAKPPRKFWTF